MSLQSLRSAWFCAWLAFTLNSTAYTTEIFADQMQLLGGREEGGMGGGGSINTKGEGEHLEEFVIFMHQKDNGMGVVRVTGQDMTPANVMTIAGLISKGGLDMDQMKPLQQMLQMQGKQ